MEGMGSDREEGENRTPPGRAEPAALVSLNTHRNVSPTEQTPEQQCMNHLKSASVVCELELSKALDLQLGNKKSPWTPLVTAGSAPILCPT